MLFWVLEHCRVTFIKLWTMLPFVFWSVDQSLCKVFVMLYWIVEFCFLLGNMFAFHALNIAECHALALWTINRHEHYLRFVFFSCLHQQNYNVSNICWILEHWYRPMTWSDIMNYQWTLALIAIGLLFAWISSFIIAYHFWNNSFMFSNVLLN